MMARLGLGADLAGRTASGPAEPFAAPTITAPPPDSSATAAREVAFIEQDVRHVMIGRIDDESLDQPDLTVLALTFFCPCP
jgi:hypothetical protein